LLLKVTRNRLADSYNNYDKMIRLEMHKLNSSNK
jgi:hypothetical protein